MAKVGSDLTRYVQDVDSTIDLVVLDCSIDEQTEIVETESNDLNCVFQAQSVPDERKLVDESENEKGEVGGNGS